MMTGFRLNFTPLKEPLGFVKLVEWVSSMRFDFLRNWPEGASNPRVSPLFSHPGGGESVRVVKNDVEDDGEGQTTQL